MTKDEKLTKKEKRELAKEKKKQKKEARERNSKLKKLLIVVLVLGVIGFAGYRFWNWLQAPAPEVAEQPVEVAEDDWVKGPEDAEVVLIEYGDFQCPACGHFYPMVKRLGSDFPEDLKIVYRHFPLVSIHPNAMPAAKAAEAAGIQGKFWEMHDILFERQDDWSRGNPDDSFVEYAEELELDVEQFQTDYESSEVAEKVNADLLSANRLNLSSTPTFFLNKRQIDNPRSYEEFRGLVEGALTPDANNSAE